MLFCPRGLKVSGRCSPKQNLMPAIETSRLSKRYRSHLAVDGVSLSVPEGCIYGFLGPNGAGKTTTIRMLMGLLKASSGEARLLGLDCFSQGHRARRQVGYLPGDLRLYEWLTGHSALGLMSRLWGRDLKVQGRTLAERFGLDLGLTVRTMSRGTRQKLGLIMALAPEPKLLVLDEPTSALDPLIQEELGRCLRQIADSGRTVFLSSHTLTEAEQLCDRVAVLRDGKVVADESLTAFKARSTRAVTLVFEQPMVGVEPPPTLQLEERSNHRWSGRLEGSPAELLQWLSGRPLADMTLGPPDLENVFRSFYR